MHRFQARASEPPLLQDSLPVSVLPDFDPQSGRGLPAKFVTDESSVKISNTRSEAFIIPSFLLCGARFRNWIQRLFKLREGAPAGRTHAVLTSTMSTGAVKDLVSSSFRGLKGLISKTLSRSRTRLAVRYAFNNFCASSLRRRNPPELRRVPHAHGQP